MLFRCNTWPADRVRRLEVAIERGLTARQIGIEIGATKNAVIGQARRRGFKLKYVKPAPSVKRSKRPNGKDRGIAMALKRRAKAEREIADGTRNSALRKLLVARADAMGLLPECEMIDSAYPDDVARVSLMELEPHHCRWPVGEPGKDGFGFCGNEHVPGLPYCARHALIAYKPNPWREAT